MLCLIFACLFAVVGVAHCAAVLPLGSALTVTLARGELNCFHTVTVPANRAGAECKILLRVEEPGDAAFTFFWKHGVRCCVAVLALPAVGRLTIACD